MITTVASKIAGVLFISEVLFVPTNLQSSRILNEIPESRFSSE